MKCICYAKMTHQLIIKKMDNNTRTNLRRYLELILNKYDISLDILNRYDEFHRFAHNIDHIYEMTNLALQLYKDADYLYKLILAIIFHDIIYDPQKNDNEERSAELFYSYLKHDEIKQAILETKEHKPSSPMSHALCELDMYYLYNDFSTFLDISYKIFKEHQFVDFKKYQEERHKFLVNNNVRADWIDASDSFKPKLFLIRLLSPVVLTQLNDRFQKWLKCQI